MKKPFSVQSSLQILFHTAVSFNTDSGGRTKAIFQRSAGLAHRWPMQWILTMNHRMEYQTIFESWARRHDLPEGVKLKNFFEDMAGEKIYLPANQIEKFDASAVAKKTEYPNRWQRVEGQNKVEYVLRPDGSLAYIKTWENGIYVKLDRFDRCGTLRVREKRSGSKISQTSYFASSGRCFARVIPFFTHKKAKIEVEGGALSTDGARVPVVDVQKKWVARLIEDAGSPVVIIDDRAVDKLFVDNPIIKKHVPTIAVLHSSHLVSPYSDTFAMNTYNGDTIAQSERYSAVCFLTAQQLSDAREVHPCKNAYVIPHAAQKPAHQRKEKREKQTFIMVTRLVKLKQVDHAIRAFARVLRRYPAAKLEIWGNGDQKIELQKLVQELGITGNVMFMGWTENAGRVLRRATASIVVSKYEGFSLSLQEAQVHGLPVVSYKFRYGAKAMICNGVNGYLVPTANIEELADAMIKILKYPMRTRLMGMIASTNRILFSKRRVYKCWERLIVSVSSR